MKSLFTLLFVTSLFANIALADPKSDAEGIVKEAIKFSKENGKEKALAAINSGKFTRGELYVMVYDMEGKCLAHGTKPARVGQNMMGDKDPAGKEFIKERVEIGKKGKGWQSYKFQNPTTKKLEDKETYNEAADGVIFSAGAYFKK